VSDIRQRVVLVSGLSGAGKASILRALEDIGFEAIDNPPLTFIEEMVARADPAAGAGIAPNIAVGVDARSRGFRAEQVLSTLARLRANPGLRAELVFATADEQALLRRFTETRRRHPLAPAGRVVDGISAERALIATLHEAADLVIDTSDLPLAGLRQLIEARYSADQDMSASHRLAVALISFGFPAGLPREADLVLDARFLRNPHYDPTLKPLTGLDSRVGDYVEADPDFAEFFGRIEGLLGLLLPRFVQEGKKYATVAVGCTGGRHRSVHIIEKLAATLTRTGWRVTISHRELAREGIADRTHSQAAPPAEAGPVPVAGGVS